jgi:hypothetical protein
MHNKLNEMKWMLILCGGGDVTVICGDLECLAKHSYRSWNDIQRIINKS